MRRRKNTFSISVVKEAISCWLSKECLKFKVKSWMLRFCMYISKNGLPAIKHLISPKAKGNINSFNFVSIDEKHVTEVYCLIGSSDWFAIVKGFDLSCWSWIQTLSFWVIIMFAGILSTVIDASLSNKKAISSLEGKLGSVSFWECLYRL